MQHMFLQFRNGFLFISEQFLTAKPNEKHNFVSGVRNHRPKSFLVLLLQTRNLNVVTDRKVIQSIRTNFFFLKSQKQPNRDTRLTFTHKAKLVRRFHSQKVTKTSCGVLQCNIRCFLLHPHHKTDVSANLMGKIKIRSIK